MSLTREQMLAEMGISPLWTLRTALAEDKESAMDACDTGTESLARTQAPEPEPLKAATLEGQPADPPNIPLMVSAPVQSGIDGLSWGSLEQAVVECRQCGLCQQRKQAVFGVGDPQADWLFIGEGPGAEEDARGEPFVGQAGKLLDNMLAAIDLARGKKVYIANAVKCRPPGNRTPEAAEMAACRPYLERQIALIKPRIIVLLGKAAVHSILHEDKSLASLRGRRFEYAGIPVTVTYHPAYLLRNLPDKSKAWEDLLFARRVLREQAEPELPFAG